METNDGSGSGKEATTADKYTIGAGRYRSNMTPEAASFIEAAASLATERDEPYLITALPTIRYMPVTCL